MVQIKIVQKNILIYCLCVLMTCNLFGQNAPLQFETIGLEKGLSQNSVYDILQDNFGFMWFATQDGLNKYDGKKIITYYAKSDKSKQLNSSHIMSLCMDSAADKLWIATAEGLCIYDLVLDSFYAISKLIPSALKLHLETRSIKKIYFDTKHTFWAITQTDGIVKIDINTKKVKLYLNENETKSKLTTASFFNGKLIVASFNNLYYLDDVKDEFVKIKLPNNLELNTIKAIHNYNNDLWIATEYGGCYYAKNIFEVNASLYKYNTETNGIGCFTVDNNNDLWIGTRGTGLLLTNKKLITVAKSINNNVYSNGLVSNFILSLYKDKQGIIWVGSSGGGIAKYDFNKQQFYTLSHSAKDNNSLPESMIFAIAELNNGNKYYGSITNGLIQYNSITNKFNAYKTTEKKVSNDNSVYSIANDAKGNLWVVGYNGLFKYNLRNNNFISFSNNDNLVTKHLTSIHKMEDRDSLLISGDYGTIFFNLKTNSWNPIVETTTSMQKEDGLIVRHFYEDEKVKNIMWLATLGESLVEYDFVNNTFNKQQSVYKLSRNIRYILCINNMLWLATDNGIFIYDKNKKIIERQIKLSTQKGGSNVCYALQKDNNNNIWASSNNGIYKISLLDYSVKNYNTANGLSFLEFNTAATFADTSKGLISFAGVGGVVSFNPNNIIANSYSPSPIVTNILINENSKELNFSLLNKNKITLNYLQNFLTISFISPNYSSSDKINYAYMLDGVDEDWVYVDNQTFANYTKLAPGRYRFKVKSANSDLVWCTKETYVDITITPPFWKTWWFIGICLICIFLSIYKLFKTRIKKIKLEALQQQKIIDLEKDKQLVTAEAMLKGQDDERSRIAKDLHDGLGGLLSGVKISFSNLKESVGLNAASSKLFDKPITQLDNTIAELRKVAHNLMPEALVKFGLQNAIQDFCQSLQQTNNCVINFQQLGMERDLGNVANVNVYRIIQELVNNAVKYASAHQIIVQLTKTENKVLITVEDDGKGFDISTLKQATGIGITNITHRVNYLNGTIDINSKPNNGTSINIELTV